MVIGTATRGLGEFEGVSQGSFQLRISHDHIQDLVTVDLGSPERHQEAGWTRR